MAKREFAKEVILRDDASRSVTNIGEWTFQYAQAGVNACSVDDRATILKFTAKHLDPAVCSRCSSSGKTPNIEKPSVSMVSIL